MRGRSAANPPRFTRCVALICMLSFHPRKPRGGQLGREKRRRKFSRTDERDPGMLPFTNQFHDLFECCPLIGHKNIFSPNQRPAYIALFSWYSYKKFTRKLDCSPYLSVWVVQLSSTRVFNEMGQNPQINCIIRKNFRVTSFIYYTCSNFLLLRTNSWLKRACIWGYTESLPTL